MGRNYHYCTLVPAHSDDECTDWHWQYDVIWPTGRHLAESLLCIMQTLYVINSITITTHQSQLHHFRLRPVWSLYGVQSRSGTLHLAYVKKLQASDKANLVRQVMSHGSTYQLNRFCCWNCASILLLLLLLNLSLVAPCRSTGHRPLFSTKPYLWLYIFPVVAWHHSECHTAVVLQFQRWAKNFQFNNVWIFLGLGELNPQLYCHSSRWLLRRVIWRSAESPSCAGCEKNCCHQMHSVCSKHTKIDFGRGFARTQSENSALPQPIVGDEELVATL